MKLLMKDTETLIEASLGIRPMDLVIRNIKLFNVFTGEIYSADIGIYNGIIAHIDADPDALLDEESRKKYAIVGKQEFDGQGLYAIPGLIDSHVHVESSMMTPSNFAKVIIPHGTTTIITDPHEIGNVLGLDAVKYMIEASENLPMKQYILVPSCVPAVPGVENSGAEFGQEEIKEVMNWDRVLGLGELMDFKGVISRSRRMMEILNLAKDKNIFVQGHAPGLSGRGLSAYLCAGAKTDHEVRVGQEARDKMRFGMTLDARESSMSRNVEDIVNAIKDFHCPPNLTFCSDDRESSDLLTEGHINHVVRRAMESGLKPIDAIRAATLNAARSIGIENLGAIAPGYVADIVLLPSLAEMKPTYVFHEGKLVAQNGKLTIEISEKDFEIEKRNTVNLNCPTVEQFKIKAQIRKGKIATRVISYFSQHSSLTEYKIEELSVEDGYLDIREHEELKYIAIFNRYGTNDYSTGIVRNFGIKEGAIASTVSHDSHNVTVAWSSPEDGELAVKTLIEIGGGIVCVKDGKVLGQLKLPIAGLMSKLSCEELTIEIEKMKEIAKQLGIESKNPLLRIATLALPVIPNAKITDKGLVEVNTQKIVSLFEQ